MSFANPPEGTYVIVRRDDQTSAVGSIDKMLGVIWGTNVNPELPLVLRCENWFIAAYLIGKYRLDAVPVLLDDYKRALRT